MDESIRPITPGEQDPNPQWCEGCTPDTCPGCAPQQDPPIRVLTPAEAA